MKKVKLITAAAALAMSFTANAGMITFDDTTTIDGIRIDTAGNGVATVSRDLYTYSDGMRLVYNGGNGGKYAGGWYGEHGQYLQFDNAYFLDSLDVKLETIGEYWLVNSIIVSALDNGLNLLSQQTVMSPAYNLWTTLNFGMANVSRIVIDFTGGGNSYGLGRTHAWIGVDNISYSNNVAAVSEPGSLALLGAGLAGIGFARRRRTR